MKLFYIILLLLVNACTAASRIYRSKDSDCIRYKTGDLVSTYFFKGSHAGQFEAYSVDDMYISQHFEADAATLFAQMEREYNNQNNQETSTESSN